MGCRSQLERRLRYIETNVRTIQGSVGSLTPGPDFAECLLQVLEKQVDKPSTEVSEAASDILSMNEDEQTLMEEVSAIEKALFNMNLQISRYVVTKQGSENSRALQNLSRATPG